MPEQLLIPVDANCPGCGWPERTYDVVSQTFGCALSCGHESSDRDN